jgi:hypothetical protein
MFVVTDAKANGKRVRFPSGYVSIRCRGLEVSGVLIWCAVLMLVVRGRARDA